MPVVEITDRAAWERVNAATPWAQFPQSWAWGEFRASRGEDVRRFASVSDRGEWLCWAQFAFNARRFGQGYWYASRGPVFGASVPVAERKKILHDFIVAITNAPIRRPFFWRFEPVAEMKQPEGLLPLQLRRARTLSPSTTLLLDLAGDRETLLQGMHQKTRYNIGLAARKGVTTRVATHPDDLETFIRLHEETATRDKFTTYSADYLRATFQHMSSNGMAKIRLAFVDKKPLAGMMEISYGDTVTYLHGASSSEARNVMAPYALHWDAITQAQRDGAALYDFWGINPPSRAMPNYKPSWEGITRFKLGWGGRVVNLYGTWDLPRIPAFYVLAFPATFWRD